MKMFYVCDHCGIGFKRLFQGQRLCQPCKEESLMRVTIFPLSEWQKLAEKIRERDGNHCKICHSTRKLEVHHFDRDRKNNSQLNLVTLCRLCHCAIHQVIKTRLHPNLVLITMTKEERRQFYLSKSMKGYYQKHPKKSA